MADTQMLGDVLAGAAGAPINRPALNAYVAQGQAMTGLRSAQTEEALTRATKAQEEMRAGQQLEDALAGTLGPSRARVAATVMRAGYGNAQQALEALKTNQEIGFRDTLGDPMQLGGRAQTAAQQGVQGRLVDPINIPKEYATAPGAPAPIVQQTPLGVAETARDYAAAALNTERAVNPSAFRGSMFQLQDLPPELQQAVAEGRLDPAKLNQRNINIWSQLARANPAADFNSLMAGGALQRNPAFRQRMVAIDSLPEVMDHMAELGRKLDFSDMRAVGRMQAWMMGQLNDPLYQEYMTVRNDTLMTIAAIMRGVGMSDQAHRAEIEAADPSMSPPAMDAWLRGQLATLEPRLRAAGRAMSGAPIARSGGVGAAMGNVPSGDATLPPATTIPPAAAAQLREGQITTFGNGQRWTLQNGQPVQVQ